MPIKLKCNTTSPILDNSDDNSFNKANLDLYKFVTPFIDKLVDTVITLEKILYHGLLSMMSIVALRLDFYTVFLYGYKY